MTLEPTLREKILTKLVEVIDPETGVDVLRMRLVEELVVDEEHGQVSYRFRPSSPLCPLAVSLVRDIKQTIGSIAGVRAQNIEVTGYIHAEELTELINQNDV
ncbi:MAG: iron-sulfur cluster assembly protein [Chloroflexota bacterium]|nr:iron-sulfur cluster assembly protein [Chloroflexota bacterium]